MKTIVLIALTLAVISAFQFTEKVVEQETNDKPCYIESDIPDLVTNYQTPNHPIEELPENWLWNDIDGINYLTLVILKIIYPILKK